MKISEAAINSLFQQEDIEGYIDLGAPSDEYSSEAANIAAAVSRLERDEFTEENVMALLTVEWMQSFNLSETDIAPRTAAFERIAREIVKKAR